MREQRTSGSVWGPWVAKVPAATISLSAEQQTIPSQGTHSLENHFTTTPLVRLVDHRVEDVPNPGCATRCKARHSQHTRQRRQQGVEGPGVAARKPQNYGMFRASAVEPSRGAALAADAYREWQFEAGAVRSRWRDPLACPGGRARSRWLVRPHEKKGSRPPAPRRRTARSRSERTSPLIASPQWIQFGVRRSAALFFPDDRSRLSNAR
jgi:hypothetical protein